MMEGIVVFKLVNIRSKSEGIKPFLYQGLGSFQAIWMADDLSLDGKLLQPFDGKTVTVEGKMNEYDIFVVEKIQETEHEL